MHRVRAVIGIILVLAGAVWIGQGLGLIPGSFMTGEMFWAIAGFVVAVAGIALLASATRTRT